jgi:hypothetical protein
MKKLMKKALAFLKQAKDNKLALLILAAQCFLIVRVEQIVLMVNGMFNGLVGGLMMSYMSLAQMMSDLAKLIQQGA